MKRHQYQSGLTLIELMITVSIFTLLLMAGMPSFTGWMANLRVRTVGESIVTGLNTARTEAVKQNARVVFTMNESGPGWTVQLENPPDADADPLARSDFGTTTVVSARTPAGSDSVTFNGFGQAVGTADLAHIDLSEPAVASSRSLSVVIDGGGAKLCDPHVSIGDPRAC